MTVPHFFGYGSLVNRATHTYTDAHPARLSGWRRTWRHTDLRPVAFLTAIPDPSSEIDGLIAHVPGGDWAALDAREDGYDRAPVTPAVRHPRPDPIEIAVYTVPEDKHARPPREQPILLSYLDVVVQGYLREFAEEGAEAFFRTTSGWSAPIIDDRSAPRYPRAQTLSRGERAFVDDQLRALGAHVLR